MRSMIFKKMKFETDNIYGYSMRSFLQKYISILERHAKIPQTVLKGVVVHDF